MPRASRKILTALVCSSAFLLPALVTRAQSEAAEQGLLSFEQEDYPAALVFFEQALRETPDDRNLQYNLAATQYQLGRLDEAEETFMRLSQYDEWQVLADFNLARIHEDRGDNQQAQTYYQSAMNQKENERISMLSRSRLESLNSMGNTSVSDEITGLSSRNTSLGFVNFNGGIDSNATSISDDLIQDRNSGEDEFFEILGYGQAVLFQNDVRAIRAYGLVFDRDFSSFDSLDTFLWGGGFVHEQVIWGNNLELGIRLTRTELDSEKVSDEWQYSAMLERSLSFGTVTGNYQYSRFNAGSSFEQVEGDRHRFDIEIARQLTRELLFETRYRLDLNDREGLASGETFSSYSPVRNGVLAGLTWQPMQQLRTGISAEIVRSSYDETNNLLDGGEEFVAQERDNTRTLLVWDVAWRFTPHLQLSGKAEYTDSDDNYLIYDYDKTRLMLGVDYTF